MKRVCIGVVILTIGFSLFAQNVTDFTYTVNENGTTKTITITGYTGNETKITFPQTINNIPVTTIGDGHVLSTSVALSEVIIPEGVTAIGNDSFMFWGWGKPGNVTKVTLPESLRVIGENAFLANDIVSINIPAGVTSIGECALGHLNGMIYQNMSSDVRDGLVNKFGKGIFDIPW
jgi:hypothetical protein